MLVSDKPFELVGYLSALDEGPGFVVPLFASRSSNLMFVQEVGVDGRVICFRETEPRSFRRLDESGQYLAVGDEGLWGFRDSNGTATITDRVAMQDFLLPILDSLEQPFLKLQVAQFCDDADELIQAWRDAFEHLEERSPRSAHAWRDIVVIPTQMRLALEHAILSHGLSSSVDRLSRTVEVDVERGRLRLHLEPDLHAAFTSHVAAVNLVEQSAAPIQRAFRLPPGPVAFIAKDVVAREDSRAAILDDDFAIAGFGDMAMSLINHIVPRIRLSREGSHSEYLGAVRGMKTMALLQRRELSGELDWGVRGTTAELDPGNRVLLITFQLGAEHSHLLEQAIEFAASHKSKRRIIVAVIPHLPQEFEEPGELAGSVLPTLHKNFDAVWALSDRSPYTRQALPFGPARSVQAAAAHFRYLMSLARGKDLRKHLLTDDGSPSAINLVGSATGDRPIAKLVEHAMGRLAHHLFDFKKVTAARVVSGAREDDLAGVVREIIHQDAPHARVTVTSAPRSDGGPDRISVALKNVATRGGGAEEFERYCVEHLEQFGWEIDQFEPNGPVHITYREFENLPTHCKYVISGSLEAALRSRKRRRQHADGILLTNASIRRRTFALHVLNGVVPVHSSRIEALYRIYRRRYAYALTYLQQERQTSGRMLLTAAIDWLNLHHQIDAREVGKAKLASEGGAEITFVPHDISISLPLEFTRGRGGNAVNTQGRASLRLNESGWHLDHVEANGSHIGSA